VVLIGGLGDTIESWQVQLDGLADRYRLTAFDNRGTGRTSMPAGPTTVEAMADDAAGVLRALDVLSAHGAGFSGGSTFAQELALRQPELVRSEQHRTPPRQTQPPDDARGDPGTGRRRDSIRRRRRPSRCSSKPAR
jgi:hypothetical protein